MSTLAEFQVRMEGTNKDDAQKAAIDLANFSIIYNEEHNALEDRRTEADAVLQEVTHNLAGVSQAEAMCQSAFIFQIKVRTTSLDMNMRASHKSCFEIRAPNSATVDKVKVVSNEIAKLAARGKALNLVVKAFTEIGTLVNASMD